MKILFQTLPAIVVLMTLGCGADPGTKNVEFLQSLQGKWASGCLDRVASFGPGDMESHSYSRRNWNFSSDKDFDYTEIHFESETCQTGDEAMVLSGSGTYELGDDLGSESGKHVKFIYSDFSAIIKTEELASELSAAGYCDHEVWRVDESVSLFGKSCNSSSGEIIFPKSTSVYSDAVDVNANQMWLGKKETPISSQTSDELDPDLVYDRI